MENNEAAAAGSREFLFDQGMCWSPIDGARYAGVLAGSWNIGGVPNGGYQMAFALAVLGEQMPHSAPLTATGHYLQKARSGPVEVAVEVIRRGSRMSTGCARLLQEGTEVARFTATYADLDKFSGPSSVSEDPPVTPAPAACLALREPRPMYDNMTVRATKETATWLQGKRGPAQLVAWMAFNDGRPPDLASLPLFADAIAPPVFNLLGPGRGTPTLELTVHLRGVPAPGPLLGRFVTRYLVDGIFEEDGELWDKDGKLVALSRQMGMYWPHPAGEYEHTNAGGEA